MNYKLKEIECEEDFIKAFGENPGWILSPVRLRKPKQKSEETPSPDKRASPRNELYQCPHLMCTAQENLAQ